MIEAAALLPDASGLCIRTVGFFLSGRLLSDYLFRMGTDTVEWPGTIDKSYFYCAAWLEGKDNDYNMYYSKWFFLLPCAPHIWWLRVCFTAVQLS